MTKPHPFDSYVAFKKHGTRFQIVGHYDQTVAISYNYLIAEDLPPVRQEVLPYDLHGTAICIVSINDVVQSYTDEAHNLICQIENIDQNMLANAY